MVNINPSAALPPEPKIFKDKEEETVVNPTDIKTDDLATSIKPSDKPSESSKSKVISPQAQLSPSASAPPTPNLAPLPGSVVRKPRRPSTPRPDSPVDRPATPPSPILSPSFELGSRPATPPTLPSVDLDLSPATPSRYVPSPPSGPPPSTKMKASESGFKSAEEEISDLLKGKRMNRDTVVYTDSRGNPLPNGLRLNVEFYKDASRFHYLINDILMTDYSRPLSSKEKQDRIFNFCQALIREYGVNGFTNLSLLLHQGALADATDYLIKISKHIDCIPVIERVTFNIKSEIDKVTVVIKASFGIKNTTNGLYQGNRELTREISLNRSELDKIFLDSPNTPHVIVTDHFPPLLRTTPEQDLKNDRLSAG